MGAEDRPREGALLKTGQVAKLLSLSRYQVLRLIDKGEIPAERMGHDFFIHRADLEARGLIPPHVNGDAIYRAWLLQIRTAVNLIRDAIAGVNPNVSASRLAVAQGTVEATGSYTVEYDRAVTEALRALLATEGGMEMVFTSYADGIRPEVARGFALRSEREMAMPSDYAAADFFLPFMMEWAVAMREHDFRRRHVDINREIAVRWGMEPVAVYSIPGRSHSGDGGAVTPTLKKNVRNVRPILLPLREPA